MKEASILCVLRHSAASSVLLLCVWNMVSGQIRYSIPEELERGAFVGKIGEDLGLSIEEISRRKFRIISADTELYFDINRMNGILFVNARIDREQLCGQSDSCVLLMEALAEQPNEQYRVEVYILDINDNSPSFPNKEIRLEIRESAALGVRFALERAQDADGVNNSVRTYHLTQNEHFILEVKNRGKWKVPELVVNNILDRETQSRHHLLLTALDGGFPKRSSTAQITIIILDTNDNPPVFDKSLYIVSIKENVPSDTLLIQLNATDLDVDKNAEIIYSFSSYNEPRVTEIFAINSKTGAIHLKESLDFEEANVYDIDVEAKDGYIPPLMSHCNVRVEIGDVNDNAPDLTINSDSSIVSENVPSGTLIALISVTDKDSNENGYADCSISPKLPFDLKSSFSNSYRLITNTALDRESAPQYKIMVTCKDRGSPPLFTNRTIVVNISDINDNAPRFTQPTYTAYVMENNVPGSYIGSVTALDLDIGRNAQLSYSIVENDLQSVPASSYLYINSNNGSIYSKRTFDYEQIKSIQFQVRAQDAGLPLLSSTVVVQVVVLDQNDNPPTIMSWKTTRSGTLHVPRSADPGYLVTRIIASDADSGKNAQLSFQLKQNSIPGLFIISHNSGEIKSVRRFKDSDATKQELIIHVKDNGYPALSASTTLTLTATEQQITYEPDFKEPRQDLKETRKLSFYLIISLGTTSFILLLVIIVLVIAICPLGSSAASGVVCSFADFCCTKELECQHSTVNLHVTPDFHILPSVLEVHGKGSLTDTYRYKVRSAPESSDMYFAPYSPEMARIVGKETAYMSQEYPMARRVCSDQIKNQSSKYSDKNKQIEDQSKRTDILRVLRHSATPSVFLLCLWNMVFGQIRYSIPEELERGAFVGKIGKDLGLSVEELSRRKFRIVSVGTKQYLDVNPMNGILFVNARIDREQLCGQSDSCTLLMEALAENPVELYRVEIEILDINDNSPSFPNKEIHLEITETATRGVRFLLERAHDADAVNNSVSTYHLTPNKHFVLDIRNRGKWKVPELVVDNILDRETQSRHNLLLTALDGGYPERSGSAHVTIIILDTNDNPPVFDNLLYTVSVKEDVPPDTLLIELKATDLDVGKNAEIIYSFSNYNEPSITEIFAINPATGAIHLKEGLDFEEANVYEFDVEAKDGNVPPLMSHCSVQVQITDVNDNAPNLTITSVSSTVSEDIPSGTLIALISVTDKDSNDNGYADCSISPTLPFDLKFSFRNSYRLITSTALDRESAPQHKIMVTCKDRGIPPLLTNWTIVVNISDINDNIPRFMQPTYTAYVTENNLPGSYIGSVTALDLDIGRNAQLSYCIVENDLQSGPASLYLYINSNNGSIYSKRSFDYEQIKSIQFQVRAQDAGLPSLSSTVVVQVIVLDQNDNPPTIISWKTTRNSTLHVPRSADPGYLVTRIIASDADSVQRWQVLLEINPDYCCRSLQWRGSSA
ncbi:protocadherin beta-15-like [Mobula birostris]|uniref:protocadherin beta-15-like n=1 Tax=Mobula birostris TaxID=1983395 RepID=UPI003B28CA6D